jgi:hypothetical protein
MELNITDLDTPKAEIGETSSHSIHQTDKKVEPPIANHKIPNVGSFQTISNIKKTGAVLGVPKQVQFSASTIAAKPKEPTVKSYDDILSKMGMCVVNGKLKLYDKTHSVQETPTYPPQGNQYPHAPPSQRNWQKTCRVKRESYCSASRQPFQDHCEANPPMTREEYNKMVHLERIKQQRQAAEMRRVKSKRLLFDNPSVNIQSSVMRRRPPSNMLFKLKQ